MIELTSITERFVREIHANQVMDFSEMPGEGIVEFACFWLHASLNSEELTGSRDLLDLLQAMTTHLAQQQRPPVPEVVQLNGDEPASASH